MVIYFTLLFLWIWMILVTFNDISVITMVPQKTTTTRARWFWNYCNSWTKFYLALCHKSSFIYGQFIKMYAKYSSIRMLYIKLIISVVVISNSQSRET